MPMPPSGAAKPSLSVSNTVSASPPIFRPLMMVPTEPTVSIRPQKRAEQAEEDQKPGEIAQNVARLVEPRHQQV